MLYKFFNKKGNITVILIGVICVMLFMTIAISTRMTGHTRLLTISDYTQISRYFLESYMSDVMQHIREEVIKGASSPLVEYITTNELDEIDGNELNDYLKYDKNKCSKVLKDLEKIGNTKIIDCKYNPSIKIIKLDNEIFVNANNNNELIYPQGVHNKGKNKGKEKKGYISITCKCNIVREDFKKEYTLEVIYPISIVFTLTPVLKDFMLYVDNMWAEQKGEEDKLNLINVKNGQMQEENTFNDSVNGKKIRPWVLLDSPDPNDIEHHKNSGMVYFGPISKNGRYDDSLEKSIFYNISGITPDDSDDNNNNNTQVLDLIDMYLISPKIFGLPEYKNGKPLEITENDCLAAFPLGKYGNPIQAYGREIELKTRNPNTNQDVFVGNAKVGVFGFCDELLEFLDRQNPDLPEEKKWKLEDFLNEGSKIDGTYWKDIFDKRDALKYSFGIKPYGLRYVGGGSDSRTKRQIFGNVFGRFVVLSYWFYEHGNPIKFDLDESAETFGVYESEIKLLSFNNKRKIEFRPPEYDNFSDKKSLFYRYMSRIMSGMPVKDNYKINNNGRYQDLFMPINTDYGTYEHKIFKETDFYPNDEFKTDEGVFDSFADNWFKESTSGKFDTIESRIGRAYTSEEDFKNAVGYPKKFNVGGVVYVGGDLNLDDLNLKNSDCGGGIVLVDGNITLGNIKRGDDINTTKSDDIYKYMDEYTDNNKDKFIGPDKILTFVCLKHNNEERKITIKGNVLLGVQLINFTAKDKNSSYYEINDQIIFENNKKEEIVFYGAIACNNLNLPERLKEFGSIPKTKRSDADNYIHSPLFYYPSVMATPTPPLAVQIDENMHSYNLEISGEAN